MRRIIPRPTRRRGPAGRGAPPSATPRTMRADERAGDEPADVGEERDAAVRRRRAPSEASPSMSWSTNQKPEHDDRRHVDQLVEEAQEHERQDPGPREQDDVRARGPPRSRRTRRSIGTVGGRVDRRPGPGRRDDAADEVEQQERDAAEPVLDVVAEDPQVEHVAQRGGSQPPCRNMAGDERQRSPATR